MTYLENQYLITAVRNGIPDCNGCGKVKSEILMIGYCDGTSLNLCRTCAQQLARKLLEDLCSLDGDRHG